jgi:hypothetical protein
VLSRGGTVVVYQVNGSRVEWNPSPARLRELTGEMPNASVTEFGNIKVKARVDSGSTRSTYLVDDSANSRGQTITRAEYDRVAKRQEAANANVAVDLNAGVTRVLNPACGCGTTSSTAAAAFPRTPAARSSAPSPAWTSP